MRAYDLGRFQRLVQVDGDRVRGTFKVLRVESRHSEMLVTTVDVVIWDEGRKSGRVLYSSDLTAFVKDGVAELDDYMISSAKRADVQEVWDEMKEALAAAAEAAIYDASPDPVSNNPEEDN